VFFSAIHDDEASPGDNEKRQWNSTVRAGGAGPLPILTQLTPLTHLFDKKITGKLTFRAKRLYYSIEGKK